MTDEEFQESLKLVREHIADINDPSRLIARTTVGYVDVSTVRLPKIDAIALGHAGGLYEVAVNAGDGWIPAARCPTREMAVRGHMYACARVVFDLAQRRLPSGER